MNKPVSLALTTLLLCLAPGAARLHAAPAAAPGEAYYTEAPMFQSRPDPTRERYFGGIGTTGLKARIYPGVVLKVEEMAPLSDAASLLLNEVLTIAVTSNGVEQAQQTFAAHTGKVYPCHRIAMLGHQLRFHTVGRTQPHYFPALRTQSIGHRQSRVDVTTCTACHNENGSTHIGSPRAALLFWLRPSLRDLTCSRKLVFAETEWP